MKARASRFTRSVCETFAFATSETLSINSGNRLMHVVTNVRSIKCDLFVFSSVLTQAFIQNDFNPEDIPFQTLPTMSDTVLRTMLPDKEGKVFSANLHEGIFITYFTYLVLVTLFCIFCIFIIADIWIDAYCLLQIFGSMPSSVSLYK